MRHAAAGAARLKPVRPSCTQAARSDTLGRPLGAFTLTAVARTLVRACESAGSRPPQVSPLQRVCSNLETLRSDAIKALQSLSVRGIVAPLVAAAASSPVQLSEHLEASNREQERAVLSQPPTFTVASNWPFPVRLGSARLVPAPKPKPKQPATRPKQARAESGTSSDDAGYLTPTRRHCSSNQVHSNWMRSSPAT